MKTFKQLINEVAQPLSQGERNFKNMDNGNAIDQTKFDPKVLGQDHIFKGDPIKKDKSKKISYHDGEDIAAYDRTLKREETEIDEAKAPSWKKEGSWSKMMKRQEREAMKRLADPKVRAARDAAHKRDEVKEEAEEISELSTATKDSYRAKAKASKDDAQEKSDHHSKKYKEGGSTFHLDRVEKHDTTVYKRTRGLKLAKEDVEQIVELSKKTLKSYVKKAMDPSSEKSVSNLASRGGYELGSDETENPYAGIKHDQKAVRRSKGVVRAVDKLTREEVELDEAKRGRPRKNPLPAGKAGADDDGGREHIVIQLRKVVNLRGEKHVEFNDSSKHKLEIGHAKKALEMHDGMKRADEKLAFASRLAKSHDSFHAAIQGKPAEKPKPKVTLAGRGLHREEVEQIDELSNKTLRSYMTKRTSQIRRAMNKIGGADDRKNTAWYSGSGNPNKRIAKIDQETKAAETFVDKKEPHWYRASSKSGSGIHHTQTKVKGTGVPSKAYKFKTPHYEEVDLTEWTAQYHAKRGVYRRPHEGAAAEKPAVASGRKEGESHNDFMDRTAKEMGARWKKAREGVKEDFELEEGKWDYPKEIKGKADHADDHYLGRTDRKRVARKLFRKKAKAAAHKKLMTKEEVEPIEELSKAELSALAAAAMANPTVKVQKIETGVASNIAKGAWRKAAQTGEKVKAKGTVKLDGQGPSATFRGTNAGTRARMAKEEVELDEAPKGPPPRDQDEINNRWELMKANFRSSNKVGGTGGYRTRDGKYIPFKSYEQQGKENRRKGMKEEADPTTMRADRGPLVTYVRVGPDGVPVVAKRKAGRKEIHIEQALADLYDTLSEENREVFTSMMETEEGIEKLMTFVEEHNNG